MALNNDEDGFEDGVGDVGVVRLMRLCALSPFVERQQAVTTKVAKTAATAANTRMPLAHTHTHMHAHNL